MTDALRRSFAVTFSDPGSPLVIEWLERLTALVADIPQPCDYQDTLREILPQVVGREKLLEILLSSGSGIQQESAGAAAVRVMQVLFELQVSQPAIRVRYCRPYGHEHGQCNCEHLLSGYGRRPLSRQYEYLARGQRYRQWFIDRADLAALTDKQLSRVKCHPKTKVHLITIVAWLRANPLAE